MGARFRFTDVWRFTQAPEEVWAAMSEPDWPSWWPDYRRIELVREGRADGVGWVGRAWVKSSLPYTLVFTVEILDVVPERLVRSRVDGFFTGEVSWTFEADGAGGSRVTLHEDVETTWPLINWLTRFGGRRLFEWNHRAAMHRGEVGLGRLLLAAGPS